MTHEWAEQSMPGSLEFGFGNDFQELRDREIRESYLELLPSGLTLYLEVRTVRYLRQNLTDWKLRKLGTYL